MNADSTPAAAEPVRCIATTRTSRRCSRRAAWIAGGVACCDQHRHARFWYIAADRWVAIP